MPDTIDVSKLNDHELLLVLHTKFDVVRDDVRELKEGTSKRLSDVEHQVIEVEKNKASKKDLDATNERLDRVTSRQNLMIGGLLVINILLPFIFKYLFK